MPRSTADRAQHSHIAAIEQVAHLVSSTRNPSAALQRALQVLGEALGAQGGAVVLNGEGPKLSSLSWGEHQEALLQVGQELVEGIDAETVVTAHPTTFSSSTCRRGP